MALTKGETDFAIGVGLALTIMEIIAFFYILYKFV